MLLISWNVNGLRAALRGSLPDFLAQHQPDVLCLQEIKCLPEQCPDMRWAAGYSAHWGSALRKGYSGVLTLSRLPVLEVRAGIGLPGLDDEGRALATRLGGLTLLNVYSPNSKPDLSRLGERTRKWEPALRRYLRRLAAEGPVAVCGDLNVAHTELDLARPKQNTRSHGFTAEERAEFGKLLRAGFTDSFRVFERGGGHYTWWAPYTGARERNIGWRIDYFLLSRDLLPRLRRAFILRDVYGSDHCPVGIELADPPA